MKAFLQLITTTLLSFALQYYLPWWTMALAAFALGYVFNNKGYISFLAGFSGVGLLWFGMALAIDMTTHSILTEKVNQLLPMNALVLTTLVGGLVGGLGGLSGSLVRDAMNSRQ